MSYLLDTNHIFALLVGNRTVKKNLERVVIDGQDVFISAIAYYETRRGYLAINATSRLKAFETFCKQFGVLLPDSITLFDRASELYALLKQAGSLIEDADILIASSALEESLIVLSSDSDYDRVPNLVRENWLM